MTKGLLFDTLLSKHCQFHLKISITKGIKFQISSECTTAKPTSSLPSNEISFLHVNRSYGVLVAARPRSWPRAAADGAGRRPDGDVVAILPLAKALSAVWSPSLPQLVAAPPGSRRYHRYAAPPGVHDRGEPPRATVYVSYNQVPKGYVQDLGV